MSRALLNFGWPHTNTHVHRAIATRRR
jgi:hypothetical protein